MRLREALIAQRESGECGGAKVAASGTTPGVELTVSHEQPLMNMVDFSAMLQHFSTSPSSGGSVFGMNFLDQESPVEFDRNLLTDAQPPMLQSPRADQSQVENGAAESSEAQDTVEFDFMAELRKLESRAREHGRRLRGQPDQSQSK